MAGLATTFRPVFIQDQSASEKRESSAQPARWPSPGKSSGSEDCVEKLMARSGLQQRTPSAMRPGQIPLASEISWPAGSIGWRYVAAGGSPRGRDDRPMQVFQTKKPPPERGWCGRGSIMSRANLCLSPYGYAGSRLARRGLVHRVQLVVGFVAERKSPAGAGLVRPGLNNEPN